MYVCMYNLKYTVYLNFTSLYYTLTDFPIVTERDFTAFHEFQSLTALLKLNQICQSMSKTFVKLPKLRNNGKVLNMLNR
jgi:hypothetical protein